MASADANPYMVLAAVLAGVHHGITNKLDPGEPTNENACNVVDPDLPLSWESAIDRTQSSPLMIDYLTKESVDLYCETKRGEMNALMDYISPLSTSGISSSSPSINDIFVTQRRRERRETSLVTLARYLRRRCGTNPVLI